MKKTIPLSKALKKTALKKAPAKVNAVCCNKPSVKRAVLVDERHELDAHLMANAQQDLARFVMKLAKFKDGERMFKAVRKTANQDLALDMLDRAFDMSDAQFKALTASL